MQYVADFHLHSKYSRAVSPQMTLPVMARLAQQKGLDILTASDFTHPVWFKEINSQLQEAAEGIYLLKSEYLNPKSETNSKIQKSENAKQTYFLLSTEIASIYKQGEKLRRIHNLVFAPSLQIVEKINAELVKRGCNLNADGRPIIGLSSKNLLEMILMIDERCILIPCHVWTPHFGVYGSASGFDSLDEAFGDMSKYIYGVETGLSSDPDMNWSITELRNRSILSFSDAHSAPKMGREASVFDLEELSYSALKKAMKRESDKNKLTYTIEFYPEEGKYHFSGHRNCKVSYGPEEIREKGIVCPVCRRKMTEGVVVRLQQLADERLAKRLKIEADELGVQWFTDNLHEQPSYVKLVPLLEIVAEGMHSTVSSQKVQTMFLQLVTKLGSEIDILLKVPIGEISKIGGDRVAEGVQKVRSGNIVIEPGYDGEYGKVRIWRKEEDEKKDSPQLNLNF